MITTQYVPCTAPAKDVPNPTALYREYQAPNVPDYLRLPIATQSGALSTPQKSHFGSGASDYITRRQRLVHFMSEAHLSGEASEQAISGAANALRTLLSEFKSLPLPHASTGEEGRFLLFWDTPEYHFELEFFADGSMEAFHEDMRTGTLWNEDYDSYRSLSNEAIERIKLLV